MRKSNLYILSLIILSLTALSCKKLITPPDGPDEDYTIPMSELDVPVGFNWETTHNISINILAFDNINHPITSAIVKVYNKHPNEGGKLMIKGVTNSNGQFAINRSVPTYYESLVFAAEQVGLADYVEVPITNQTAEYTFGGREVSIKSTHIINPKSTNSEFNFLGSFSEIGVPSYLSFPIDIIAADYLEDLTINLPKNKNAGSFHPSFFSESYDHDLLLECASSVWLTFVHENTDYNNTLAFYTYDIENPPASSYDIDTLTIIFPNTSKEGSGGGLHSGDKVKIGTFPENTGIGWALISDGWDAGVVTYGRTIYYSNKNFNIESNSNLSKHSLLLKDTERGIVILAFEDIARDNSDVINSDHDFNDLIFHIFMDPVPCSLLNLPIIDYEAEDNDGDNIPDIFDDYPNDENKSFNNYFPCYQDFASLVFEDLWPGMGDFDFNDLVLNYNINQITNSDNYVSNIDIKSVVKAHGADFHNGFGIELPTQNSNISNVIGTKISQSYVNIGANGAEAGNSNAIIIVFDDTYNVLAHPGLGTGVNSMPNVPYVLPDTMTVSIELSEAEHSNVWSKPPYNPFLIINKTRGHEVHLPNYPPTPLCDESLLNTIEDNSDPSIGRYFKTVRNLPFGINIVTNFEYPYEQSEITEVYLKFAEWVQSSGVLYKDWFIDNEGYRNYTKVFQAP